MPATSLPTGGSAHRSRRRKSSRHRDDGEEGEGGRARSRGRRSRRHRDKPKGRHGRERRSARHVLTDSSTVASPRDSLAPAPAAQDPRILEQVDELCGSIPEFAEMSAHERKLMVDVLQPFTAEAGTRFITQGDEGDAMYILAVGVAAASISRPGAPDEEVKRYKAGDYFGELALMDNAPRAANIDAKSDITCLRIAAADFDRVLGGTAAYASMERKAVATRAIKARVMAQATPTPLAAQPQPQPQPTYAPQPQPEPAPAWTPAAQTLPQLPPLPTLPTPIPAPAPAPPPASQAPDHAPPPGRACAHHS